LLFVGLFGLLKPLASQFDEVFVIRVSDAFAVFIALGRSALRHLPAPHHGPAAKAPEGQQTAPAGDGIGPLREEYPCRIALDLAGHRRDTERQQFTISHAGLM
jgi:hypothetical protein